MRKSLLHVSLVVREYDEAIEFFCKKLGFTVLEDTYQPAQDKRWVLIAPPGSAGGTTLLLARASDAEQRAAIGRQTGGRVFLFLGTDDFERDYTEMRSAGIRFVREPKQEAYGTVAVFEDLYGNRWDLIQRPERSREKAPTLFLLCGLPGAGKTTVAKRLEHERCALRLDGDEWLRALFGRLDGSGTPTTPDRKRDAVEALQWQIAERALALGVDVVLDWGVWTRAERDRYRARARELGARVELVFLDAPLEELWRRIEARNAAQAPGEYEIDRASLELWSTWFERPTADELATPDGDVAIDLARPEDVPALPAIERAAATLFASWPFPIELPQDHTPHEEFAEAQREGRLFVARTGEGRVVGFAQGDLVGGEPHLEEVDVLPEFGRRGIGRALVEAVCGWARARGHARITLTTFREVPWNEPFYARLGFRELADAELSDALRAVVEDEAARGLDPALRVVMARPL
jgi:predicted kinase/GNAT superfamily N-acetyltransferase/uncharacterized glyoxalase superfamily protein PhnB